MLPLIFTTTTFVILLQSDSSNAKQQPQSNQVTPRSVDYTSLFDDWGVTVELESCSPAQWHHQHHQQFITSIRRNIQLYCHVRPHDCGLFSPGCAFSSNSILLLSDIAQKVDDQAVMLKIVIRHDEYNCCSRTGQLPLIPKQTLIDFLNANRTNIEQMAGAKILFIEKIITPFEYWMRSERSAMMSDFWRRQVIRGKRNALVLHQAYTERNMLASRTSDAYYTDAQYYQNQRGSAQMPNPGGGCRGRDFVGSHPSIPLPSRHHRPTSALRQLHVGMNASDVNHLKMSAEAENEWKKRMQKHEHNLQRYPEADRSDGGQPVRAFMLFGGLRRAKRVGEHHS